MELGTIEELRLIFLPVHEVFDLFGVPANYSAKQVFVNGIAANFISCCG